MSLINRAACKKLVLEYSERKRGGKFTRVSDYFLLQLEWLVHNTIRDSVESHPTKGKTITEFRVGKKRGEK